jgi:hypothetical protein
MIPEKHVETVRELAAQDGRDDAEAGLSKDACEWMQGTIFYDDYCNAWEAAQ